MSIEVLHIEKWYGATKVLDDVSFSLTKGEVVGFLGPNGAGKSTTMKIICGFLQASKGEVLINGKKIDTDPIAAKRSIGYLPENNPLYLDLYTREYLHFIASIQGLSKKNAEQRIQELAEQIEIVDYLKSKISTLSKGYRQRVGLLAALLGDPNILILDEPTAGLDPNQSLLFRNLIRSLSSHKTILFSSHILSEIEAVCNRCIIIHKGKIIADDTTSQLKAKHFKGTALQLEDIFKQLTQ